MRCGRTLASRRRGPSRRAVHTSFQRSPAWCASAIISGVTDRIPSLSTCWGFRGIPMMTVDNAATLMAASHPSISALGSVSVMPIDCPWAIASSSVFPSSSIPSNRLVQEFRMPWKPVTWTAGREPRNKEKMGAPSITADSNKNRRFRLAARVVNSAYPCTTGPLLAVMACIPL